MATSIYNFHTYTEPTNNWFICMSNSFDTYGRPALVVEFTRDKNVLKVQPIFCFQITTTETVALQSQILIACVIKFNYKEYEVYYEADIAKHLKTLSYHDAIKFARQKSLICQKEPSEIITKFLDDNKDINLTYPYIHDSQGLPNDVDMNIY